MLGGIGKGEEGMDSRLRGNDGKVRGRRGDWIPAFAGMTGGLEGEGRRWIPVFTGMTEGGALDPSTGSG